MSSIFTSIPIRRSQATSQLFIDYGNSGQIPAPIGDTNVYAIATKKTPMYSLFRDNIGTVAASRLLCKDIAIGDRVAALIPTSPDQPLVNPAPLVVHFEGKELSEEVETKMSRFGFRKESQGRQTFYRGSATVDTISAIMKLGGSKETYAPFGAYNIEGHLSMQAIQNLLIAACECIPAPLDGKEEPSYPIVKSDSDKTFKASPPTNPHKIFISNSEQVRHGGLFFPYFDGLTLPDKNGPISLFLRHFSYALGSDTKTIATATQTLRNGWKSVATTASGLALSHAIFCFDIGLQIGAKIRYFHQNGRYAGTILYGTNLAVMKGSTIFQTIKRAELKELVHNFDRHEGALSQIAAILSVIPPNGEEKSALVLPEEIDNPRKLHEEIRNRTVPPEKTQEIRKHIGFLRFDSTLWSLTEDAHIVAAVKSMLMGNFLDTSAPMAYRTDALFTKDCILSTLSAFGTRAPSLVGPGNNIALPVLKSGKTYENNLPKDIVLQGIPVYVKPLQQAVEDWKTIQKTGSIYFKSTVKDSNGYSKLPQCGHYLPFESAFATQLNRILADTVSMSARDAKAKKRAREDRDDAGSDVETAKAKRTKRNKDQEANVFTIFARGPVETGSGQADVDGDSDMDI